jgi:hypothetical protein
MSCNQIDVPASRREFLQRAGCGFGAVALAAMTEQAGLAQSAAPAELRVGMPAEIGNGKGRAKQVIFLFMEGGPSHLDTFDPKFQGADHCHG